MVYLCSQTKSDTYTFYTGGNEIYNFVAFVVTDEDVLVVKIDEVWSSSNEARTPTILAQEHIIDLMNLVSWKGTEMNVRVTII